MSRILEYYCLLEGCFEYCVNHLLMETEIAVKDDAQISNAILIRHRNGFNGLLVVAGLGFGIIGGAFSMVNVLADMSGPGTIGLYGDSSLFFVVSCEYQTGRLHLHFERDTNFGNCF